MCLDLPLFNTLDDEQRQIYALGLDGHFVIKGPPGTGKSVMALHRAAKFVRSNEKVLVLMYNKPLQIWTKSALDLALTQAGCTDEQKQKVEVRTVESWFQPWFRQTFGVECPTENSLAPIQTRMTAKYGGVCSVCRAPTVAGQDLAVQLRAHQKIHRNKWMPVHNRCLASLRKQHGYPAIDWSRVLEISAPMMQTLASKERPSLNVIVDEGQDLPNAFYTLLKHLCNRFTVFVDGAQGLNDADRYSTAEQIENILNLADGQPSPLKTNHRNKKEVAELASKFRTRQRSDVPAVASSAVCSEPIQILNFANPKALAQYAIRFKPLGVSVGIFFKFDNTKKDFVKELESFGTDTWVQVYAAGDGDIDLCKKGAFVANYGVAKGLEFDVVIIGDLQNWPAEPRPHENRTFYVLASRSRDILKIAYTGEGDPPVLQTPPYSEHLADIERR